METHTPHSFTHKHTQKTKPGLLTHILGQLSLQAVRCLEFVPGAHGCQRL